MLPPDLNLFLFADVGIERSGMTLTVLSALAHLDLDPWDEAGRLSKLSRVEAANSFAGRLAMLPAKPGWPQGTAARLVALLPQDGGVRPASATVPATASLRAVYLRITLLALLVVVIVLALGIVGHWGLRWAWA